MPADPAAFPPASPTDAPADPDMPVPLAPARDAPGSTLDARGRAIEVRRRPCAGERICPWRRDADLTKYSDRDKRRLVGAERGVIPAGGVTDADTQIMNAIAMTCHLDQDDTAHPGRLCAGWTAVIGRDHVRVRMAVIADSLPASAIDAGHPGRRSWPALYGGLDELLAARAAQLAALGTPEEDVTPLLDRGRNESR